MPRPRRRRARWWSPNRRHPRRRKWWWSRPGQATFGLAVNMCGMADGFGWVVTGVIRLIPMPFGFAAIGEEDLTVGTECRDAGIKVASHTGGVCGIVRHLLAGLAAINVVFEKAPIEWSRGVISNHRRGGNVAASGVRIHVTRLRLCRLMAAIPSTGKRRE